MKHDDTKERILAAGMELVPLLGYKATGIEAVLQKAGVPKGSFYHFFPSKEQFCMALLARYAAEREKILDHFLADAALSPLERIRGYLKYIIAEMRAQDCTRGCFAGNLAQELSDQNEAFRTLLADVFARWQEKIAACLTEAQSRGELHPATDCCASARFLLSSLEGAILQAKVLRSVAPLEDILHISAKLFFLAREC